MISFEVDGMRCTVGDTMGNLMNSMNGNNMNMRNNMMMNNGMNMFGNNMNYNSSMPRMMGSGFTN